MGERPKIGVVYGTVEDLKSGNPIEFATISILAFEEDKVITGGGLIGTVTKAPEGNEIQVEVAEGVRVKVVRHTIQEILTKPEPAAGEAKQPANDAGASGGGQASSGGGLGKLLGLGGKKSD